MKILVVDDDGLVRRSLKRMLAIDGHDVIEAGTEAVAVAVIAGSAKPDCVLSDLRLGHGSGSGLGVMAAAAQHGVPAALITSHAEAEIEARYTVLLKPFNLASLRETLEGLR